MPAQKIAKQTYSASARENMIDGQITPDGVIDQRVIDAFADLPRENFLPENLSTIAYQDRILSWGQGHFLLPPSVHARMVEALNITHKSVVLDVSYTNGYSAAILSQLAETVILPCGSTDKAKEVEGRLLDLNITNVVCTDTLPEDGSISNMPYDMIFMHGACTEIPIELISQLKDRGYLATILLTPNVPIGRAHLAQKISDTQCATKPLFETQAPYLPKLKPSAQFVF